MRSLSALVLLLAGTAAHADAPMVEEVVAVVRGPGAPQPRLVTWTRLEEEARIALVSRGGIDAATAPLDRAALRAALTWVIDLPVTVPEAALGAEVTLPTFEGPVRLRVPPGTQAGKKLRLRGRGLPDLKGGARGDLYAVVQLVLPEPGEKLDKAVKALEPLYKKDPRAGLSL